MKLKELRRKAGLSQKDVSDHMGYTSPQYVSNWERGITEPSLHAWMKLAKLYNVDRETIGKIVYRRKIKKLKAKYGGQSDQ